MFYFAKIPEISDEDMQYLQEITAGVLRHDQKPFRKQYRLFLEIWGQFMYVKAWTYSRAGYPSALALTSISLPTRPKENEIHLRVQAAALNPVDIQLINLPIWNIPGLRYQKGVGEDFAGEVIAVGSAVQRWKVGDQIWGYAMTLVVQVIEGTDGRDGSTVLSRR